MSPVPPLPPEKLRYQCDPATLGFETTAELEPLHEAIGQDRALEALHFGAGIRREGYNLFALGPVGAGKHDTVAAYLRARAVKEAVPADWCYVHNFADPNRPRALKLPPGRGSALRADMDHLVEDLRAALPAAFESEEYRNRRQAIQAEIEATQEKAFEALKAAAQEKGIVLLRTPMGLTLAPVRGEEVIDPEEFGKLPAADQERIRKDIEQLQGRLQDLLRQVPRWEREQRKRLRELRRETAKYAVGHILEEFRHTWQDQPAVLAHLDAVQEDVIENVQAFLPAAQGEGPLAALAGAVSGPGAGGAGAALRRYQVNCIVAHEADGGAPVVYEDHPGHHNLIGRVEHLAQMGALLTDFTLIKPGALHRANGGYLVLDARKLLQQPYAWESLKRALRAREIKVESLAEQLSLVSTVSLEPQPIPLDCKVVLIGERQLYYLMAALDPDFGELFKVALDFEEHIPRTCDANLTYARWIGTVAHQAGLRPLARDGVARVLEHAARLAGDQERLSTHVSSLRDLLVEADYRAGEAGRSLVQAADVQQAIDAQIRRADRIRDRMQEEIARGTILIDVTGAVTGQVNGLSVVDAGGFAFGRPTRITARVRLGKGELVDIEREVEMGGPIHTKGVLILAGYLGQRYARDLPLALSASLVFEQSYSGVEGDSASAAELFALLSALADAPLSQAIAVTGSVNQRGFIQAIGGVNEKIEGFFDVCARRGLDGTQGILMPAANVRHLMLRHDVIDAVREGRFRIHAIETVDQGLELLTGIAAGEAGAEGEFPEGTLNRRVQDRLREMSLLTRMYAQPLDTDDDDGGGSGGGGTPR